MANVSDYIRRELRSAWSGVFLDGRNEHGTHVLPLDQRSVGADLIDKMLPEYAEMIMEASESAGHVAGDAVVVTWSWVCGDGDEPSHFELLSTYHADLTEIFYGTPYQQKREREADEQRADESAAQWV